jgi:hypothetical protein
MKRDNAKIKEILTQSAFVWEKILAMFIRCGLSVSVKVSFFAGYADNVRKFRLSATEVAK